MEKELILIGASGHAKVVLSVALANQKKILGYFDDNPELLNQIFSNYSVLGDTSFLATHSGSAIFSMGNNAHRKKIAERHPLFTQWETLVHPSAIVHPSVKLGKGTVVFAGAIIQPDVVIGDHCIINTGATVDHDCVIGNYVHLAPGVHLAGGVEVNEGAFLGIGSVVIPNLKIGEWSQIGAGGVVVNNILAKKMVMGIPAKERIEC